MTGERSTDEGGSDTRRREFLVSGGAFVATALAGCSRISQQEFSAEPVYLGPEAREELGLAETARDSSTVTRTVDAIDGEVTITSHVAAYRKIDWAGGRDRPTLLEAFASRVNGTEGAGSAVVAYGSDLGLDRVTLAGLPGEPTIDGSRISLVVPAGARNDGGVTPDETAVLVPGGSVVSDGEGWFLADPEEIFPQEEWMAADGPSQAGERWLPEDALVSIDEDTRVLLPPSDGGPGGAFGLPSIGSSAERVGDKGNSPNGGPLVVVAPGNVISGGERFDKASPKISQRGVPPPWAGRRSGRSFFPPLQRRSLANRSPRLRESATRKSSPANGRSACWEVGPGTDGPTGPGWPAPRK